MTNEAAMNFIDATYIKYVNTDVDNRTYLDDVITILNKVTNSKIYEIGESVFIKNNYSIVKNKQAIFELKNYDCISLAEFLNKEILLFKLEMIYQ